VWPFTLREGGETRGSHFLLALSRLNFVQLGIRQDLKSAVLHLDNWIANISLGLAGEGPCILSFIFHGLFADAGELESDCLDPQQGITVPMLEEFISYFKRQSYKFISPADMLLELPSDHRYMLVTFDDGYYTNVRALPVMEQFEIPAVFFVSSGHVTQGKAYWWDVVFRELKKLGKTQIQIRREQALYKTWKTADVEKDLRARFGESSMQPVCDLDRPFRRSELREFAKHPLVSVGNHTRDHAILTNYSPPEIREQIQGGQDDIRELTGKESRIIAYPNGNCGQEIVEISRAIGLQLGMTTHFGKNTLPLCPATDRAMRMRRFMLWGQHSVDLQCRISRADLSISQTIRKYRFRAQYQMSHSRS
jgi:peptidoglycan/xylan/chitin deacetylase (PgdA/CDA1 family)